MSVRFKLEAVPDPELFSTTEAIKDEVSNQQPLLDRTGELTVPESMSTQFWEDYFNTHPEGLTDAITWEEL